MKLWLICASVAQICAFPLRKAASQWDYDGDDYGSADYGIEVLFTIEERDISSSYGSIYYNYSGAYYYEHEVNNINIELTFMKILNIYTSHLIRSSPGVHRCRNPCR